MANVSSAPPVPPPSVTFLTPATMNAPPAKRPRLSPGAATSPSYYSYTTPIAESSFNEPLPAAAAQMPRPGASAMKPPDKPSDKQTKGPQAKVTDLVELSDIFKDSGVDLREEENYLYDSYKDATVVAGALPFSQGSTSVPSPSQTFDTWRSSQNATQLTQASGVSAPFSQPPVGEDEMKDLIREKHQAAAIEQAKSQELHLKDPFIMANSLRERMELRTSEYAVRHKPEGITSDPVAVLLAARGERGQGIVAAKALLASDSSLVPLLSLISLATRERLRSVLEDSYGTSRARVFGSGGVVPPEWTDMAKGDGKAEETTARPQSLSGTPWDAVPDSAISPLTVAPSKRPRSDEQKRRTPLPEPQAQRTVRFSSRTPTLLVDLGTREVELERARLSARKKRTAKEAADDAAGADGSGAATPLPTTSPASPAAPTPPKLTKKERERQAKPVQTEEALRRQSNMTANMQLGGFSRKYQWLTAASGGGAAGKAGSAMTPGTGLREKLAAGAMGKRKDDKAKAEAVSTDRFKTVGRLLEKPGIQLRDVVSVLELEGGKEKKALLKGYTRLEKEK